MSDAAPPTEMPLVLGGHSFISQLGNDPPASEREQRTIVESCLAQGIAWFDTTYQPERVALGNALHALGRRHEARIIAWNFFTAFSAADRVGEAEPYRPEHIEIILQQLRTAYVDCLVMVPLGDAEQNERQEELLVEWQRKEYVRSLGLWIADPASIERDRCRHPFRFAIRPFNVTTADAAPVFAAFKRFGWETLATSPFVRGWELDRLVARASSLGYGDPEALRSTLADLMLRFALFHGAMDRVIVAMRKAEWVARNVARVSRGPLTAEERRWLQQLCARARTSQGWWQRLRRRLRRAVWPRA